MFRNPPERRSVPLIVVDGVRVTLENQYGVVSKLTPGAPMAMRGLPPAEAVKQFGADGQHGAVIITSTPPAPSN